VWPVRILSSSADAPPLDLSLCSWRAAHATHALAAASGLVLASPGGHYTGGFGGGGGGDGHKDGGGGGGGGGSLQFAKVPRGRAGKAMADARTLRRCLLNAEKKLGKGVLALASSPSVAAAANTALALGPKATAYGVGSASPSGSSLSSGFDGGLAPYHSDGRGGSSGFALVPSPLWRDPAEGWELPTPPSLLRLRDDRGGGGSGGGGDGGGRDGSSSDEGSDSGDGGNNENAGRGNGSKRAPPAPSVMKAVAEWEVRASTCRVLKTVF